jgi:glycosyltransferase involved in cell wall biosynthesis
MSPDAPPIKEPPLLSIMVTCYNEEDFILDTLQNVVGALKDCQIPYEVLVIDDCSKDRSVRKIQEYILNHPDQAITLKANQVNRGLAQNYVDGAFLSSGLYYRMCCGDNAEPRDILRNVFQYTGKADVIIPYQIQSQVEGKSPFRQFLSKLFTSLVNLISGYSITYYNGLAIHLRYNVMRYHPSSYGFGFQADILTRILDQGASYLEIPSSSVDRKGAATTALSLRNILSVAHSLLEILARRVRNELYGKPRMDPSPSPLRSNPIRPSSASPTGLLNTPHEKG